MRLFLLVMLIALASSTSASDSFMDEAKDHAARDLSLCTFGKNWKTKMPCYKEKYEEKYQVMNNVLADIMKGLNNKELVKSLPIKQQVWNIKSDEECKVDVLKNIRWVEDKKYLDKVEFYSCKYVRILARIKELSSYPYINFTCQGNFSPGQTPAEKTCPYFDDFDAEQAPWLCPHKPSACLCGEQAKSISTYLPDNMQIAAACELEKIEGEIKGSDHLKEGRRVELASRIMVVLEIARDSGKLQVI